MPVAIPANVGSVIYVQMRMIACVAYMAGVVVNGGLKQTGIKVGVKFANGRIKKIPGKVIADRAYK